MPARRRREPIPARKPSPSKPPFTGAWSVIPINGEPIRKKTRKGYEKVLKDIETAKAEIERFESEDNPQYHQWFHRTFGARITELRELNERLQQVQALVLEIEQECIFGGWGSVISAYRTVMKRRKEEAEAEAEEEAAWEQPTPEPEEDSGEGGEQEDPFGPGGWSEAEREEAYRRFASEFGFEVPDPDVPPKPEPPARAKELYRQLVRRLHPDRLGELSPKEVEWWHQTQEAYESGNIEQLEMILTLCEIEDAGTKEASVGVLMSLISHFKSSLRALKRQLTQFKRDPAWNFSLSSDHSNIEQLALETLASEKALILMQAERYEAILKKWESLAAEPEPARKPRARRQAATAGWVDEEWF